MRITSIKVQTVLGAAQTVQNAFANINLAKLTGLRGPLKIRYYSSANVDDITEQLKAGTNNEPVQSGSRVNNAGGETVSVQDDWVTTFDGVLGQELFLTVTAVAAGNHMCLLQVTSQD